MFHKLSLFVVAMSLSVSAFADVGGRTRSAAPSSEKVAELHKQIFDLLAGASVRESDIKEGDQVTGMMIERKDKVTCDAKANVCRNSKNVRVTGEVAKEVLRLIPQDAATRAGLGGKKVSVERGEVICVALQQLSGEISYNCK